MMRSRIASVLMRAEYWNLGDSGSVIIAIPDSVSIFETVV